VTLYTIHIIFSESFGTLGNTEPFQFLVPRQLNRTCSHSSPHATHFPFYRYYLYTAPSKLKNPHSRQCPFQSRGLTLGLGGPSSHTSLLWILRISPLFYFLLAEVLNFTQGIMLWEPEFEFRRDEIAESPQFIILFTCLTGLQPFTFMRGYTGNIIQPFAAGLEKEEWVSRVDRNIRVFTKCEPPVPRFLSCLDFSYEQKVSDSKKSFADYIASPYTVYSHLLKKTHCLSCGTRNCPLLL
jgi:hypothetical protein